MRSVAALCLLGVVPAVALAGPQITVYPISSKPVFALNLVKTMPGQLVVTGWDREFFHAVGRDGGQRWDCLLYTSPSPRD